MRLLLLVFLARLKPGLNQKAPQTSDDDDDDDDEKKNSSKGIIDQSEAYIIIFMPVRGTCHA